VTKIKQRRGQTKQKTKDRTTRFEQKTGMNWSALEE